MAVLLEGTNGLFTRSGKAVYAQKVVRDQLTSLVASDAWSKELNDVFQEFATPSNAEQATIEGLVTALESAKSAVNPYIQAIATSFQNIVIAMVNADTPLAEKTLANALAVLIQQMNEATTPETVLACQPTVSVQIDGPRFGLITACSTVGTTSPTIITSNGHGLAIGDRVYLSGLGGSVELNGTEWAIEAVTSNTFSLASSDNFIISTYTSGGKWHANDSDMVIRATLLNGYYKTQENAYDETLVATVTSQSTQRSEVITVVGEKAAPSKLHVDWPMGSGASAAFALGAADNATNNILTDGSIDSFTTNVPDNWPISVGAAGVDIFEETSNVLVSGGSALKLLGTGGSPLSKVTQSGLTMSALTVYGVCFWVRNDGTVPTTGVLQFDLYDTDAAAIITDEEGNNCSVAVTLTSQSQCCEVYRPITAFFRIEDPKPANIQARLHLTTALQSGRAVYVDHIVLRAATLLYAGGPYVAGFSGSKAASMQDKTKLVVVNARAGKWQTEFERNFDMSALGLLLPSVNSGETIAENLIS